MPISTIARRSFAIAAAAWAINSTRPAVAASERYQLETGVWTNSMLLDAKGKSFVLRDLQQPITLLKLWAGWCPACAAEMPQLTEMTSALGRGVGVLLISHPQYWAADQAMAHRRRLPFPLATFAPSNSAPIIEQALLGSGGVYSVPKTLAFRARDFSIVLKRESSTDWSSPTALNQVRGLAG